MSSPSRPEIPKEEEDKNKSKLQAVILLSIVNINPSIISLASTASIDVTISARQIYSVHPSRALTISTWRTPFNVEDPALPIYTGDSLKWHLLIQSVSDTQKVLWAGRSPGARRVNYRQPDDGDLRAQMSFITVPSLDSGKSYSMTRPLAVDALRRPGETDEKARPAPGEEYLISLESECYVHWWNWGSLDGELRGKQLIDLPHPSISGRSDEENRVDEDCVVRYGWDMGWEDNQGNEMVYLEVEAQSDGVKVKFVE